MRGLQWRNPTISGQASDGGSGLATLTAQLDGGGQALAPKAELVLGRLGR